LFACGPADATAIPKPHHLLPHLNPDWFYVCVNISSPVGPAGDDADTAEYTRAAGDWHQSAIAVAVALAAHGQAAIGLPC